MEENLLGYGGLAKGLAALSAAAVGAWFRQLSLPFLLLLVSMALDYGSGLARAWFRAELSSAVGLRGIVKKLCYLLAVAVAVTVDLMLQLAAEQAALDISGCYFCALLVTVWLTMNECISILENISDIGVPVPAFLLAVVKRLKTSAEAKAGPKNGPESGPKNGPESGPKNGPENGPKEEPKEEPKGGNGSDAV